MVKGCDIHLAGVAGGACAETSTRRAGGLIASNAPSVLYSTGPDSKYVGVACEVVRGAW